LKKTFGAIIAAVALLALASPSSADDEMQCFEAGAVYWMGFQIAACELGAQPVTCLRCVTGVTVKEPENQIP